MRNRRTMLIAILPVFACFALLPQAQAACQDGCNSSLFNAFQGDDALISNTTGAGNTALGWRSLFVDTTGSFNTAVGGGALVLNNGSSNTAVGAAALLLSPGSNNTAVGADALVHNGVDANTAIGAFALFANTTGIENVAVGFNALSANVGGGFSVAVGFQALEVATSGQNTAVGDDALLNLTTGNLNTALGDSAGLNLVTGFNNTYVGEFVGGLAPDESSTIRIADDSSGFAATACFVGGISGVTGANFTDSVILDPITGQLGDGSSSAQYKKDIASMDKASEAIFSLKPVTFHYKNDETNTPQYGLIAEEVAKVNPALVGFDKEGKPHSVQYMKLDAMLLNEFLKEHREVQEQGATIARLEQQIDTLTAGLQKVSTELELSKSGPQTVLTNQ